MAMPAKAAIVESDNVYVSPISMYEVVRKAHLGKWPEIIPHLRTLVRDTQVTPAPLTFAISARAGMLDWAHRDPFDRMIAATVIELGCPLISKDHEFDLLEGTNGWPGRIWSQV